MLTVLTTGAGVIGNSQATLDDLAAFAGAEGLPSPPSLAAWLGTTERLSPAGPTERQIRRPSWSSARSKLARTTCSCSTSGNELIQRLGSAAPSLLIIGHAAGNASRCSTCSTICALLREASSKISNLHRRSAGRPSRERSRCPLPDLFEGFGLPLIEALARSTPVIASDLPVFREIGEGVPDCLDPLARLRGKKRSWTIGTERPARRSKRKRL